MHEEVLDGLFSCDLPSILFGRIACRSVLLCGTRETDVQVAQLLAVLALIEMVLKVLVL
jgi:hypothetical protein